MNKLLVLLTGILLFSCSEKQEVFPFITLSNPSDFERISEPIIISQSKIDAVLGSKNQHIYFEDAQGTLLPFQKDELSGRIEYSLSLDFKPTESKKITIKIAEVSSTYDFIQYTNIRLGKDENADGIYDDIKSETRDPNHVPGSIPVLYQAEGISWENDLVGFRSYWDKRNGKDIWGKTTSKMVLDSIGLPNTPSYHELQYWGTDVLKVGNSLGAGALAMVKNENLYRLGETDSASFKILVEGPIRAVMTLDYRGWFVEGEPFDIKETITIWKGQYGYHSRLKLTGSKQKLVTGIVNINLKKDTLYTLNPNAHKTIIYTYDQQSELGDNLGLGLILESSEIKNVEKAANTGTGKSIDGSSPISHTYYAELFSENGADISFYFLVGWEKTATNFESKKGFERMLVNEANKLNSPIQIE